MSAESSNLLVLATTLEERGGFLSRVPEWFGLGGERTLRVTVANIGTEWLDGVSVDAGRLGTTLAVGALGPGEQRTLTAPVWLPMSAFGHDASPVYISGDGSPIEFSAATSTWPWALIVLAAIAIAGALVWRLSRFGPAHPGRVRLVVRTLALTALILGAGIASVTIVGDHRAEARAHAAQRELLVMMEGLPQDRGRAEPDVLVPGAPSLSALEASVVAPLLGEVPLGEPLGVLRIPALGEEFQYVVIEGVRDGDLARGPGHYPGTALPGRLGNFVLSAHRTSHSAPFAELDQLTEGGEIRFDAGGGTFMYRITSSAIVPPTALEVLLPVPGRHGETPTTSMLTLVTCHPEHSTRERLVVTAELLGFVAE